MDLLALLNGLLAQLTDAKIAADKLADDKYAEGFAAGVASVVVVPVDGAELEVLKAKVAELESKVAELEASVSVLRSQSPSGFCW